MRKNQMFRSRARRRTARVLVWVNEIRAEHNLEPLLALRAGHRIFPDVCPVARSLGTESQGLFWNVGDTSAYYTKAKGLTGTVILPLFVIQWIRDFDHRKYPEYQLGG